MSDGDIAFVLLMLPLGAVGVFVFVAMVDEWLAYRKQRGRQEVSDLGMSRADQADGENRPGVREGQEPETCDYCKGTGEDPEYHLSSKQKAALDAQQIGPGGCPKCEPRYATSSARAFFEANP